MRCPTANKEVAREQQEHPEAASNSIRSSLSPANLIITPYRPFTDGLLPTVSSILAREANTSNGQPKRGSVSKHSPAGPRSRQRSISIGKDDSLNNAALTSRLDELRIQLQELQAQDEEEETEFVRSQAELTEQRDDLKRQLKDRDDQNKDLSKSVKSLEHANSAAQNKKAQQEKALNDKLRSRTKMQEDVARWNTEIREMNAEAESLKQQQESLAVDTKKRVAEIKREQKPELEALSSIEEQIQQKGKEVQELDKEKKMLGVTPDHYEFNDRSRAMAYEERQATDRISEIQAQIHEATLALLPLKAYLQQMQQQLEALPQAHGEILENGYVPNGTDMVAGFGEPAQDAPSTQPISNARVNFDVPETRPSQAFVHARNDTSSTSASYRTSSPFHSQGSPLSLQSRGISNRASNERLMDRLTGGAMVSPSAGALLPSDLLGDEADEILKSPRMRNGSIGLYGQSSNSRPASSMSRPLSTLSGRHPGQNGLETDSLPGLGTGLGDEDPTNTTGSPHASHGSDSPSAFSSPHSSFANLHGHKLSDPNIENDRRSIRSASGSNRIQPSSWSRFAFGRQRGATASEDGPALGSLRSHQSQSMPRENSDTLPGLGTRSTARPSGGLFGFGRRPADPTAPADFGAIGTPVRTTGSRPESTYSMEGNALPDPSEDKPRFGWDARRTTNSRFGAFNPWSSHTGRRSSLHNGSTTSFVPEVDDVEEEEDATPSKSRSRIPAPIGTKPAKSKASASSDPSTQLNPAARDFTTMFGFGKKADRSDKTGTKAKRKSKVNSLQDSDNIDASLVDSSPPDSRKSRDTYPGSFTDSFEDISEEPDHSLNSPLDATPLSASSRGSLMRRITSKSSKGNFLGLKTKKTTTYIEDGDEDSGSSKLGQSVESITSTPTQPTATPDKRSSTSSFFSSIGRRKKKPNEAPSLSEASLASETGDEADSRTSADGTST